MYWTQNKWSTLHFLQLLIVLNSIDSLNVTLADVERHPIPASATCFCVGFVPASRALYLWIHLVSFLIVVLLLLPRIHRGRGGLRGSQRSDECCLIGGSFLGSCCLGTGLGWEFQGDRVVLLRKAWIILLFGLLWRGCEAIRFTHHAHTLTQGKLARGSRVKGRL